MAESSLSLGFPNFQVEVGYFLGFGRDSDEWDADTVALVTAIINTGVRWFYYPQAIPGIDGGNELWAHSWSFLKPLTTITMEMPYSTGTVSSVTTVVTITDGTWPSWAATHGTLVVDGTSYAIASQEDDELTLSTAPDTAFDDDTFVLNHDGNYDCPDDFGGVDGPMTYAPESWEKPCYQFPEALIRVQRQHSVSNGPPCRFAVRPKTTTGATGQRREFMFFPIPDDEYVLSYTYQVLPSALSETYPYPYGGMQHAETVQQACLAAAELRVENQRGAQWQEFMTRLTGSIMLDRNSTTAQFIGYNGDPSSRRSGGGGGRSGARLSTNYYTTYDGFLPS